MIIEVLWDLADMGIDDSLMILGLEVLSGDCLDLIDMKGLNRSEEMTK